MPPSAELKVEMYRRMLLIRRFEDRTMELHDRGEIAGAVHTSHNQEAAVVGATAALRSDDYMTGTHRSHAHPIGKGAKVDRLMAELLGKRTGVCKGKGGSQHLADFSVGSLGESGIVAAGVPIAVGAGLSARVRGTDQVCVGFFGDGASNEGAIHESMNLASVWSLPVIFLCENNGYAATTSLRQSTSVREIGTRSAAYGIPGVTVDGQDPAVVYDATIEAVERARAGDGPSLVEALTYRTKEHAAGFPAEAPYRDEQEVAKWLARDPLRSWRERLLNEGLVTADALAQVEADVEREVDAAVEFARSSEDPAPDEAFEDIFADPVGGAATAIKERT